MTVKPLEDRVIIQPQEAEDKTEGGIFIPETAKEKPLQGRVISVGAGRTLDNGTIKPLNVKKNDLVLYSKFAGSEVKLNGESYLIIREEDIMGIIE